MAASRSMLHLLVSALHMLSASASEAAPLAVSADGRFEARAAMTDERTQRVRIFELSSGKQLIWAQLMSLWSEGSFGIFFSQLLAKSPFDTFFWECPPLNSRMQADPFEYVTIRARGFRYANPSDFAAYISGQRGVHTFRNLGGDAVLVAPAEEGPRQCYGHIAAFVRCTPSEQQVLLWATLSKALSGTLSERGDAPTWLSTEGSGLPWLHVRLDSVPKYYHTQKYTRTRARLASADEA